MCARQLNVPAKSYSSLNTLFTTGYNIETVIEYFCGFLFYVVFIAFAVFIIFLGVFQDFLQLLSYIHDAAQAQLNSPEHIYSAGIKARCHKT